MTITKTTTKTKTKTMTKTMTMTKTKTNLNRCPVYSKLGKALLPSFLGFGGGGHAVEQLNLRGTFIFWWEKV